MRSSTTSTSSERGVKTLSRCTSKNIGWVRMGTVARTAGLKRSRCPTWAMVLCWRASVTIAQVGRSEEHTSELQSQSNLVCRLLLEKKKKKTHSKLLHITLLL